MTKIVDSAKFQKQCTVNSQIYKMKLKSWQI